VSDVAAKPTLLRKDATEELSLLKTRLPIAAARAAKALRGDVSGGAAEAKRAQLADEKLQAIKRRILDIEESPKS
jgi:hypothetical protein